MGLPLDNYIQQLLQEKKALPSSETKKVDGRKNRRLRPNGRAQSNWTAEELAARGLPLWWDSDWLKARFEEGMSYTEMARRYGYSVAAYVKEGNLLGLRRKYY